MVSKFAVFSIFRDGTRPKIVTKNDITLLTLDILSKFKLHDKPG